MPYVVKQTNKANVIIFFKFAKNVRQIRYQYIIFFLFTYFIQCLFVIDSRPAAVTLVIRNTIIFCIAFYIFIGFLNRSHQYLTNLLLVEGCSHLYHVQGSR